MTRSAPDRIDELVALRRVRDRIDRDFADPFDLPALARLAHMSEGHFSRRFRAAFGETPHAYLMTRRIERAMALLRRNDLTVTEVCFAVGFASLGSFSTRFSELVGTTPSAYRAADHSHLEPLPPCVAKLATRPVREPAPSGARTGPDRS